MNEYDESQSDAGVRRKSNNSLQKQIKKNFHCFYEEAIKTLKRPLDNIYSRALALVITGIVCSLVSF